jgi:hypothetical protein
MTPEEKKTEAFLTRLIRESQLRAILKEGDTHKKQCVVTDHGFVEPVAQSQINSICYDLFNQGQRVDHIQLFRNDENGNYTSFISYTVLKDV